MTTLLALVQGKWELQIYTVPPKSPPAPSAVMDVVPRHSLSYAIYLTQDFIWDFFP